jgi:predicted regulator of Ras-like GTPase activity (Roadblock/LC7/MglB family)
MLARALDRLLAASPEVEAAAVVSGDGLPMASALPSHVEEERLAAMSAALLTLGDRAAAGLGKGVLQQVFIEGSDGHVILMSAGSDAVLVTIVERGAKIGLVLFEVRRTASEVGGVMDIETQLSEPEEAETPANAGDPVAPEPLTASEVYSGGIQPAPPEPTSAEVVQPSVNAWE